jgi:hypothetical protein
MSAKKISMSATEPWKTSQAKELLKQDIVCGTVVNTMLAEEVYEMRAEYKR